MNDHVLVATVGNIFLGDDGFGCDVARALLRRDTPRGIIVRDFGTRTLDLEMALEGAAACIVIDVVNKPAAPGTLYVIDPAGAGADMAESSAQGHAATSTDVVLRVAARVGREQTPRAVRVLGCVPETFGEAGEGALGLSDSVARAVEPAADLAIETALSLQKELSCTSSR